MIQKRTTSRGVRYDVRLRRPDGSEYSKTFRTKKAAEDYEAEQRVDRARGQWVDPTAGRTTFAEWVDEWRQSVEQTWRPSTRAKNATALDRYWLPEFGPMRMESVSPRNVQQAINRMTEKLKPSTVRSYYGVLAHLFNDAVDLEVIGRSPCRAIKLPKLSHQVKRVIGPADLHRLADEVGPDWRLLIYLGGVMGLRIGEALGLQWSDVDFGARTLTVSRTVSEAYGRVTIGEPKTRSSLRTLAFPAALAGEFIRHREHIGENPSDFVFQDAIGGPVRASNLRYRVFDPAVRAAGLDGVTFHGLRHSAATEWVASGIDARTVQYRLGHSDPALVLRLYAHHSIDADRRAADTVGDRFWPTGGG